MFSKMKTLKVLPKLASSDQAQTHSLSQDQLKFYDEHGFLVIKELIDFNTLYACKQRFIQISKGIVEPGAIAVVKEPKLINTGAKGEDLVNKLQDILYDDVLCTYTENPVLLNVMSQLIGDNLTGMHSMLINKPPGTGRHPPHQDLYYFPFRPAKKISAAWTAIDHVHLDNGCLFVVPGTHKQNKLYEHGHLDDASKLYHGILNEDVLAPPDKRVPLEMSPGDTVFFHPLLIHGSGPNVTKNYRKAISCHYANNDCYYIDVKGTLHEDLAKEVETVMKKKGFHGSYADVWRAKSKLVKGVKSNL